MTTLGERVRVARKAKGWTQAELARGVTLAFPMSQGGIAQIEIRRRRKPKSIVQFGDSADTERIGEPRGFSVLDPFGA